MKIAISGAANTGKTTLAGDLAKEIKLPLIEERFAELPRRTPQDRSGDALAEAFLRIDREKLELEKTFEDGFISDRCSIDLFNYWISFPVLASRSETSELYKKWKTHANHYDYVVFLSWGSIAYVEIEQNQRQRIASRMNPWLNMSRHCSTLGLAHTWLDPNKIIIIPRNVTDRKKRVNWLLDALPSKSGLEASS